MIYFSSIPFYPSLQSGLLFVGKKCQGFSKPPQAALTTFAFGAMAYITYYALSHEAPLSTPLPEKIPSSTFQELSSLNPESKSFLLSLEIPSPLTQKVGSSCALKLQELADIQTFLHQQQS